MIVALAWSAPAQARNVPGSASAIQSRIDRAVASSLIDTTLISARDAALFNACAGAVRDTAAGGDLRAPCDWGISFGGGLRQVEGSPNGFEFDFTSAFGNLTIAHAVTPGTTLFASLIGETGSGDLAFNRGTLDNHGVGTVLGAIFRLNDTLDLSLLGGAEWLNYETTRSNGLYRGEYDATRYLIDANLRGLYDGITYFIEYGGGLRYIHQKSDGYIETSGGVPFAAVPSSTFSVLTALGDVKLGTRMDGFTPYLQATGFFHVTGDDGHSVSFGTVTPEDEDASGRFGLGVDIDVLQGKLSLTSGVFVGEDGYQGADGGFKFAKTF